MSYVRTVLAGLLVACASVSFHQNGLGADNADTSAQGESVARI
jgi:hypothetical protein